MTDPDSGRLDIDDNRLALEKLLFAVNAALSPLEQEQLTDAGHPAQPLLFFCFSPRSGSTLVSQALAATGEFAYVSNFVARFWSAPVLALILEKSLGLRRLSEIRQFTSSYGGTSQVSEPHEFGFFWKENIPFSASSHYVPAESFDSEAGKRLGTQIYAMMSVYRQPFFFKNSVAGLNCHYLSRLFPHSRFLVITRDPVLMGQSIILGRERHYGNRDAFWSLMPSNTPWILQGEMEYPEQVALQIAGIYADLYQGLMPIRDRTAVIRYEHFCADPRGEIQRLFSFLDLEPADALCYNHLPEVFTPSEEIKIEEKVYHKLCLALEKHQVWDAVNRINTELSTATN